MNFPDTITALVTNLVQKAYNFESLKRYWRQKLESMMDTNRTSRSKGLECDAFERNLWRAVCTRCRKCCRHFHRRGRQGSRRFQCTCTRPPECDDWPRTDHRRDRTFDDRKLTEKHIQLLEWAIFDTSIAPYRKLSKSLYPHLKTSLLAVLESGAPDD